MEANVFHPVSSACDGTHNKSHHPPPSLRDIPLVSGKQIVLHPIIASNISVDLPLLPDAQVVLHLLRAGLAEAHESAAGTQPTTVGIRSADAGTADSAEADQGQGASSGAGQVAAPERHNSETEDRGAALAHPSGDGDAGFREESGSAGGHDESRSYQGGASGEVDARTAASGVPSTFCTIFFDTADTFPEIRTFTQDLGTRYGHPLCSSCAEDA